MKLISLITIATLFSVPALADSAYWCGASGSRCQSKEYQAFLDIAATAFPDAASYELNNFAYACEHATKKVKKICRTDPKKAAQILDVFNQ